MQFDTSGGKFRLPSKLQRFCVILLPCALAAPCLNWWPSQVHSQVPDQIASLSAIEHRVEMFCGDCHRLPNPKSFDRDRWYFEVKRGYEFYAKSGRQDLELPTPEQTLAYFRQRAPQQLEYLTSPEAVGVVPVKFVPEHLTLGTAILPEIADIRWTQLASDGPASLLATDMRYGQVVSIDLSRNNRKPPRLLAQLRNPGRTQVCDFNSDGQFEILVADLASYMPSDHERSRLVMLAPQADGAGYREVELLTGLGRISDVLVSDLDGDDKQDLVVAEFGWRDVGRLQIAKNISPENSSVQELEFQLQTIDDRPGALSIRLQDFDGDGRDEIAAIHCQEYESINIFQNDQRRYACTNIWQADDLTFGCSGMEVVDLNQDGLADILFTNGDTFDNGYVSPWHGVQWLENLGGLKFQYHRLTEMPGAYCARATDFNHDGRLDIVVSAALPSTTLPRNTPRFASIVLLLQTELGHFDRYTLEWDAPYYPALTVGDFDGDGDQDFAVASGPYVAELRGKKNEHSYLSVWWNEGVSEK